MKILVKLSEDEVRGPYTLEEVRKMVDEGELFAAVDRAEVNDSGVWIPIKDIPGFSYSTGPPKGLSTLTPPHYPPDPIIEETNVLTRSRLIRALVVSGTILCIVTIISLGPKMGSWFHGDKSIEPPEDTASANLPPATEDESSGTEPSPGEEHPDSNESSEENTGTGEPDSSSPGQDYFQLRVAVKPEGAGSIFDLHELEPFDVKSFAEGNDLSLKAVSNSGWMFLEWQLEGNATSEVQVLKYKMPNRNLALVARFKKNLARDLFLEELEAPADRVFVVFTSGFEDAIEFVPEGVKPPLPTIGKLHAEAYWPKSPIGRIIKFTQKSAPFIASRAGQNIIFENDRSSFSINPTIGTLHLSSLPGLAKGEIPAYRLDIGAKLSNKFTLLIFDAAWIKRNSSRIVVYGVPKLEEDGYRAPYGWQFHSRPSCRMWNENYDAFWDNMSRAATAAKSLDKHPGQRNLDPDSIGLLKIIVSLYGSKNATGPLPYWKIDSQTTKLLCSEMEDLLNTFRGGSTLEARDALAEFAKGLSMADKNDLQEHPNAAMWMHQVIQDFLKKYTQISYFDPPHANLKKLKASEYLDLVPMEEKVFERDATLPVGLAREISILVDQFNSGSNSKKREAVAKLADYNVIVIFNNKVKRLSEPDCLARAKQSWGKKIYRQFQREIAKMKAQATRIDLDAPFRKSTWSSSESNSWSKSIDEIRKGLEGAGRTKHPDDSRWTLRVTEDDYNHLIWR